MFLKDALHKAGVLLKDSQGKYPIEDPSYEAGLLLSWVLKKDLSYIYAHMEDTLTRGQEEEFLLSVKRRCHHEPYSYITGECEFLSLNFKVNPSVLIPRADTELLAEAALFALGHKPALFNQKCFLLPHKESYRVLDVGTGSGCLAISLARLAENTTVDAIDISYDALKTAKLNAVLNNVEDRINFINCDFLNQDFNLIQPFNELYDIIVSNPPYIPVKDIEGLMEDVKDYEPFTALAGGEDGLIFYRALSEKASSLLCENGIILTECGIDQAQLIMELFKTNGMEAMCLKDLSCIDRVVLAKKGSV